MKKTKLRTIAEGNKKAVAGGSRGGFTGSRGWLAAGTLVAAAIGSSTPAMAFVTKDGGKTGQALSPEANLPVKRFSIAAGTLEDGLHAFQVASGLTIKQSLPAGTMAGFQTQGVTGLMPSGEALTKLLEGTGLSFRLDGTSTLVVGLRASADVSVTAQTTMPLSQFTEALTDTPQSITVVPQYIMKEQGISTLRDTLRNVPGISLAAGEGGAQGDSLTIRGFTARNDIFMDGIRDFGSYYRDSFNYEQVEVLEGPAGIEFGRGSTGGVINQESKRPTDSKFVTGTLQLGTDLTRRITVDVNRPLGHLPNGGGVAFRMNVMGDEANIAGRDVVENKRFGVAPSLAFGLGTTTRATVSWVHLGENDIPDYGIPWLLNKPAASKRSAYYGFRHSNFLNTHDDILTAKIEHDLDEHVSLRSVTRFANYPRNTQITEPQVCSNGAISTAPATYGQILAPTNIFNSALLCSYNNAANPTATDPATIMVNRNQITVKSVESDLWQQDSAILHFNIGHVAQSMVLGIEGGREMSNPTRFTFTGVPPATLLNPNEDLVFSGTKALNTITHVAADSGGVYFVDTMHLGRYIDVTGGIRYDYFYTQQRQYTASTTQNVFASRTDKKPSYRAAFVVKPTQHGSVYFDYGTSFNPSAESLSLSASTSVLPPEENETYEVGTKWDFLQEHLTVAGAAFRTVKDNARETSPSNALVTVLAGNQEVKGMQVSVTGRMPHDFNILSGYAYLDSKVIASQFFPNAIGAPLANVPKQTFNAWLTRGLLYRFVGGLGGNYVASRTASSTIPYVATAWTGTTPANAVVTAIGLKQVPGYWAFNAEVHRPINERFELQANVYNLLNRAFIDEPHPSHLVPGAGRSALFGVNYKF
ncbi:TonB-dependent receptor [Granulicella arctica]|uniref:TonB-dependent receptor n=1 Tax=Granulicella arctica TaxID=940613 RepID=UPI0021E04CCD|nr:TonB-dependent receptor [Granulicella arctica]